MGWVARRHSRVAPARRAVPREDEAEEGRQQRSPGARRAHSALLTTTNTIHTVVIDALIPYPYNYRSFTTYGTIFMAANFEVTCLYLGVYRVRGITYSVTSSHRWQFFW